MHCPVEGMETVLTATIILDRFTNCEEIRYGTTTTGVWTADGCSAKFEICGEALTTVISEIHGTHKHQV